MLLGGEVRLGYIIIKSENGNHQSSVVYSSNSMNGNIRETGVLFFWHTLKFRKMFFSFDHSVNTKRYQKYIPQYQSVLNI